MTVAKNLREKTHSSLLVVTLREGEEQGICSATLRELVRTIEDQDSTVEASLRHVQLKYMDVEGMRLVSNNRCIAEKIKGDKVEHVATVGINIANVGKVGNIEESKNFDMDGVEIEEFVKLEEVKIPRTS